MDAVYFTVTTLSTVGFGDVVATGQARARVAVTCQVVFSVTFISLAAQGSDRDRDTPHGASPFGVIRGLGGAARGLPRLPAALRAVADPPAGRHTAHSRRGRPLGKAGQLRQRAGARGRQDARLDYLVAGALAQGCDTLVSIGGVQSNHAAGRGPRSARGPGLRPDPGELGRVAGRGLRPGRQRPAVAADRRRRAPSGGFGIEFKASWEQALHDVETSGGTPTRSRQGPPTTGWEAWGSPAGRPRSRPRSARSGSSSTPSWCAR